MENPSTYSDLELFTRELTWDTRTTISKLYSPSFFGALGFGLVTIIPFITIIQKILIFYFMYLCILFIYSIALATNYFQRRPIMSGNLKNLIF